MEGDCVHGPIGDGEARELRVGNHAAATGRNRQLKGCGGSSSARGEEEAKVTSDEKEKACVSGRVVEAGKRWRVSSRLHLVITCGCLGLSAKNTCHPTLLPAHGPCAQCTDPPAHRTSYSLLSARSKCRQCALRYLASYRPIAWRLSSKLKLHITVTRTCLTPLYIRKPVVSSAFHRTIPRRDDSCDDLIAFMHAQAQRHFLDQGPRYG